MTGSLEGINKMGVRRRSATYAYLLDGDRHRLTPGEDISSVETFRVMLTRMCRARGLRYRTAMYEGALLVEVYRDTPGDLFSDPDWVEDAAPGPWPGL